MSKIHAASGPTARGRVPRALLPGVARHLPPWERHSSAHPTVERGHAGVFVNAELAL